MLASPERIIWGVTSHVCVVTPSTAPYYVGGNRMGLGADVTGRARDRVKLFIKSVLLCLGAFGTYNKDPPAADRLHFAESIPEQPNKHFRRFLGPKTASQCRSASYRATPASPYGGVVVPKNQGTPAEDAARPSRKSWRRRYPVSPTSAWSCSRPCTRVSSERTRSFCARRRDFAPTTVRPVSFVHVQEESVL